MNRKQILHYEYLKNKNAVIFHLEKDIVAKLIRFQIFDNQDVILFVYSISIQPLLRAKNPNKRE